VGASGWEYRVPFAGSVEASLLAVQEQVLASGDYIWPWDSIDPEFLDEDAQLPRPSSLADLTAAKQVEEFWDEGTHTILDVDRMIGIGDEPFGAISPLSDQELNQLFGTLRPSAADFDGVHQPGPGGELGDLCGERGSGRSMVIYKDGIAAEVYFWGFSGD
jgi:hypothetical protein